MEEERLDNAAQIINGATSEDRRMQRKTIWAVISHDFGV